MKWKTILDKEQRKYLNKLDVQTALRIVESLRELEERDNPLLHKDVRKLTGRLKDRFRLRVGEYRIIFRIKGQGRLIEVSEIVHRGEAYKR
jgi:mRNA interferase RelE/StbE